MLHVSLHDHSGRLVSSLPPLSLLSLLRSSLNFLAPSSFSLTLLLRTYLYFHLHSFNFVHFLVAPRQNKRGQQSNLWPLQRNPRHFSLPLYPLYRSLLSLPSSLLNCNTEHTRRIRSTNKRQSSTCNTAQTTELTRKSVCRRHVVVGRAVMVGTCVVCVCGAVGA